MSLPQNGSTMYNPVQKYMMMMTMLLTSIISSSAMTKTKYKQVF